MVRMLHLASRRSKLEADGLLAAELRELGELQIVEDGHAMSDAEALDLMRQADVLLTMWGARPIPSALAAYPGRVRYILNLTGTCKAVVPPEIISSAIPVTNWGDTPANAVAEGAMTLLLSVMKDLRPRTEAIGRGKFFGSRRLGLPSGTLRGTRVGLYGCGIIGQRLVEMIRPFQPQLLVYDPFVTELPEDCERVYNLDSLCHQSEALIVLAGLTDETRDSINADRLAMLPDHGIIVNVARGDIIDQPALFAELESGRLRAGLDVLAGNDSIPQGCDATAWPNLILTAHDINAAHWPERPASLTHMDRVAIDNLKRFLAGEPLRFVVDERRFALSS